MGLQLNTSDSLYNSICHCIMAQSDGSAVIDVANSGITFTAQAGMGISSGNYGYGFSEGGSGFSPKGWTVANVPATLGPAGVTYWPGWSGSITTHCSVFVALNSFTSAANAAPYVDLGGAGHPKPGVASSKDALYMSASGAFGTGSTTLSTTNSFTQMICWTYNGGAGAALSYYSGFSTSTPDYSGTATASGSSGGVLANLCPTSGQGAVVCSIFAIVVFNSVVSATDFARLTSSLTGSGAFALVAAPTNTTVTPGAGGASATGNAPTVTPGVNTVLTPAVAREDNVIEFERRESGLLVPKARKIFLPPRMAA